MFQSFWQKLQIFMKGGGWGLNKPPPLYSWTTATGLRSLTHRKESVNIKGMDG